MTNLMLSLTNISYKMDLKQQLFEQPFKPTNYMPSYLTGTFLWTKTILQKFSVKYTKYTSFIHSALSGEKNTFQS